MRTLLLLMMLICSSTFLMANNKEGNPNKVTVFEDADPTYIEGKAKFRWNGTLRCLRSSKTCVIIWSDGEGDVDIQFKVLSPDTQEPILETTVSSYSLEYGSDAEGSYIDVHYQEL